MTREHIATQDHLHPAMTHALQAAGWVHKTIARQETFHRDSSLRQTLEFARDDLRQCLAELDAFEAAVWPALASGLSENVSEAAE